MKKYRKIPILKFLYEISNDGELRNVKSKKVLSVRDNYGYDIVTIIDKTFKIHRLVYSVWGHDTLDEAKDIHHKDGNKKNNHISNLEQIDRITHMKKHKEDVTSEEMKVISDCMSKEDRIALGKNNSHYVTTHSKEVQAVRVCTKHDGVEICFNSLVDAAEWIHSLYPEFTANINTIRVNIGKSKGIVYKHKWYRK